MVKVLVIAPHPDDEVLGCGGTIAKHVAGGNEVYLCVVTRVYPPEWPEDEVQHRKKECLKASEILGIKKVYFLDFPAVKLDTIPQKELNDSIFKVMNEVQPEIVYIPHVGDVNRDHAIVFNAAIVAVRPKPGRAIKKTLSYEVPSETEWAALHQTNAFIPNLYVDISETLEGKKRALSAYKMELREYPHPRSLEGISTYAKFRGLTIGVKAAEAFMLVREIWV